MFKGTCTIDRNTVDEVAEIMCERIRFLYSSITLIAALVLIGLYLIKAGRSDSETRMVMALLNIVIMGGLVWLCMRSLKKTYSRVADNFVGQVKNVYHSDSLSRVLEFDGALMTIQQDEDTQQYWLSNLLKVYETRTQIVMKLKDNLYLWIAKDSIEGGSTADFLEYIRKYEKEK